MELDGGTLILDGEESPSVVLRLVPWCARSVAWALEEWSAVSCVVNGAARPSLDELDLSRTLELAAPVFSDMPSRSCANGLGLLWTVGWVLLDASGVWGEDG